MDNPKLILREFANNPGILNIELGAGCGNFGELFYPECFLTDRKPIHQLQEECRVCYVTISCDAYSVPCKSDRFEIVLMCNPYGYGFNDKEDSQALLNELFRITRKDGEVYVLGHSSNKYTVPTRVERRINTFNQNGKKFDFSYQTINCSNLYPNYQFYSCDNQTETKPTVKITLKSCK